VCHDYLSKKENVLQTNHWKEGVGKDANMVSSREFC
jgi:hypothetical protein